MSGERPFVTLFSVMLCSQRVRTLTFAGWVAFACALPENAPPPDEGGTGGSGNNTAAGGPTGGKGGSSMGGTTTGGSTTGGSTTGGSTTGGSSTGGSTTGGSTTGGSTTGGSSTGGSTGGGMAGASTGGATGGSGAGRGGAGGAGGAGQGGTMAGAGMGGKGGTGGSAAGQGGTMAGAGMGGTGGTGGTPGVLVHRYSFTGSGAMAMDSVGTAHGTIVGGTQSGGVVTLMGGTSDQYVQLPTNVLAGLSVATFEVWASWTGGTANWQRIFDFGNSDAGGGAQGATNPSSPYFFLTPRATTTSASASCTTTVASMPRVAITGAGPSMEDCVFGTAAMPTGMTHLAVVLNGTTMALYIAGTSVGTPVTLSVGISAVAGYDNNWLGRSQFSADTEYAGTISEFRIYNTARTSSQISASASAGPDSAPTQ